MLSADRLGSVRHLVDPSGQVQLSQSYDPFGNVLEQGGPGQSIFGYTGEQMDPTGLVFLRARFYDPSTGRFLTADSIIPDPLSSIGWNRYAYVGNDPVNRIDPSGHCFLAGIDTLVCVAVALQVAGVSAAVLVHFTGVLDPAAESIAQGIREGGQAAQRFVEETITKGLVETYPIEIRDVTPCYQPTEVGRNLLQPVLNTPLEGSYTPTIFGTPLNPGIEIPHIFEANPYGRRGSPAHQTRIRQAEQILGNRGWTTVSGGSRPEAAVKIPGGGIRYPDLVMQRGSEQIAVQVGKVTATTGLPIPREMSALQDLQSTGNYKHVWFLKY